MKAIDFICHVLRLPNKWEKAGKSPTATKKGPGRRAIKS